MKPNRLRIVEDELIDIGRLIRADIMKRDWNAVHCQGDRNRPVELSEMRRGWRA